MPRKTSTGGVHIVVVFNGALGTRMSAHALNTNRIIADDPSLGIFWALLLGSMVRCFRL